MGAFAVGEFADVASIADLRFARCVVRAVVLNANLFADDGDSADDAMGEVNRVDSCRLAESPRYRAGQHR